MSEIIERIACLEADRDSFREWQHKQNGSLQRLEEKIDKIYFWLVTLMGGVSVSLILLIVQLVSRR